MNEKETKAANATGKLKSTAVILTKTLCVILVFSLIAILGSRYFPLFNDMGKTVVENWYWFLLWRIILYVAIGYLLVRLMSKVPPQNKVRLIKLVTALILVIEVTSIIQILRG